mmetsp:Transcript_39488/g.73619  ORF Transcript_39488/g.73619 Transcript_39488/m.73619 type:complete len:213 (+) Transcript_39488:722-1360(+)
MILVSDRSKSCKSKTPTKGLADAGNGPYGGNNCFVSMWKDMQAVRNPAAKRGANPSVSTPVAIANPVSPNNRRPTGGRGASKRDPTCGSGTPKDDTVAVTTNVLKQEKPISNLARDSMSGSWSSVRTKLTRRTYANMSGDAHLDRCWTHKMTHRKISAHLAEAKRKASPQTNMTSSKAGITMENKITKKAPILEPVFHSKWARPDVVSVHTG